jgi:tight adherence protein B
VRSPPPDLAAVASVIQRLAVLLSAGVPPGAAWGYLGDGDLEARVSAADRAGTSIPDAILEASGAAPPGERQAWLALAAAWAVATDAGAPLAPTLREVAGSLRELAQSAREIAVALAAPTATARLVIALPPVGVVFGLLLGFNTIGVLLTTPAGWLCVGLGAALLLAASRWNRRMVRRAQPTDLAPGLPFDLLATALSGGASITRATRAVSEATERFGLGNADTDAIGEVVDLSRRAGVPAGELLRSEAVERRRASLAAVQARAQALSVRLMIPLGLCVLPAFMLLCVIPMLLSVLAQTSIPD